MPAPHRRTPSANAERSNDLPADRTEQAADSPVDAGDCEFLTCPICLEAPLLDPVTAPCGHSIDARCYEKLLASGGTPKCPVCRSRMPPDLKRSLALHEFIVRHHSKDLHRRRDEPIWEELRGGGLSADSAKHLVELLRVSGSAEGVAVGVDMVEAFSLAVSPAQALLLRVVPSAFRDVYEAAWRALLGAVALLSHAERLAGALRRLAERFVHIPTDTLVATSLEQCSMFWAIEGSASAARGAGVEACGERGAAVGPAEGSDQPSELEATSWHRLYTALGVLKHLLHILNKRFLSLPPGAAPSAANLVSELLASPFSQWPAEERSGCSFGARPRSVRARLFAIAGLLALTSKADRGDTSCVGGRRLRGALITAIAPPPSDPESTVPFVGLTARRSAVFACRSVLHSVRKKIWVANLLTAIHSALESPAIALEEQLPGDLLCLLGDIYALSAGHMLKTVLGKGGASFHRSCSLLISAEHAAKMASGQRRQSLRVGALFGLGDMLLFLNKLNAADAQEGLTPHKLGILRVLQSCEDSAAESDEEVAAVLHLLRMLLALCAAAPASEPWASVVVALRDHRGYISLLERARSMASRLGPTPWCAPWLADDAASDGELPDHSPSAAFGWASFVASPSKEKVCHSGGLAHFESLLTRLGLPCVSSFSHPGVFSKPPPRGVGRKS